MAKRAPPAAPLRLYDVSIDDYRPATQLDIDQLMMVAAQYARLRELMGANHAETRAKAEQLKSQHGAPHGGRLAGFAGIG